MQDNGKEPAPLGDVEAKEMARALNEMCPHGWGFVLLLISQGPEPRATFASSLERQEVVDALREMADAIEGGSGG
jgi:hypothetical protein